MLQRASDKQQMQQKQKNQQIHQMGTNIEQMKFKIQVKKDNFYNTKGITNLMKDLNLFNLFDQKTLFILISFLIDDYHKLIRVSSQWYFSIQQIIENELYEKMDVKMVSQTAKILELQDSWTTFQSIQSQRFRIDRNLIFRLKEKDDFKNKQVTIAIMYKMKNKEQVYINQYTFIVVTKKKREVWIQKNENKNYYDQDQLGQIQPLMEICQGDHIKIGLNFYNNTGLTDLCSMDFLKLKVMDLNQFSSVFDVFSSPTTKLTLNPIEQTMMKEWEKYEYFNNDSKSQYDCFKPNLEIQSTLCAGVSQVYSKMKFKVVKPGYVRNSRRLFGVDIEVYESKQEVTSEIKKNTLYYDMENRLELKVDDTLIFYLCKG